MSSGKKSHRCIACLQYGTVFTKRKEFPRIKFCYAVNKEEAAGNQILPPIRQYAYKNPRHDFKAMPGPFYINMVISK